MAYDGLFILIEGDDDERFFNRIIRPMFDETYDSIFLWKYAQKKGEKIRNFLKSIDSMEAKYIYLTPIFAGGLIIIIPP